MAKGYWLIHVTVKNPDAYKEYVERDTPIIEGLGGRFMIRGGQSETVEGTSLSRHVMVEFPSYEAALSAYHDPAYQDVADIRRANADSSFVIVEGTP